MNKETIRERDAEIDDWSGLSVLPFVSALRALLAAGDALAEAAQGFRGYVDFGRLRKGGLDANYTYLNALDAWRAATE